MRWAWVLLIAGLVAGCAGPTNEGPTRPGTDVEACAVTYPDGSAFDCGRSQVVTSGVRATAPTLIEGWRCLTQYQDGTPGKLASYVHQDGRVGVYWDLKPLREDALTFVEAHMWLSNRAMALVVPLQARGFAEFPEKPNEDRAEMHLVEKSFRIEVQEGGNWSVPQNTSIILGRFEGEAWYVYQYAIKSGTAHVDMMDHRPDPESKRKYTAGKQFVERPDHSVYADVFTYGAKYRNVAFLSSSFGCDPPGAPV